MRDRWSSQLLFVLAATGAAVGLGNVWKFPYIAGENGGGAFVLVYLGAIALVGMPVLIAEVLIGRLGDRNIVDCLSRLSQATRTHRLWRAVGWLGMIAPFVILSMYSVVGGWALTYVGYAATGKLDAPAGDAAGYFGNLFGELVASPGELAAWHTLFMCLTVWIVAGGVRGGLERLVRWLMPCFFLLLVGVVSYGALTTDTFARAARFLLSPNFDALTVGSVVTAIGHAFFTLSVGAGAMLAYGSYLPRKVRVVQACTTIAVLDTLVALLAGLAIFPLVFAHGLEPSAGPGLVFTTLPIAFAQMPAGQAAGLVFFALLSIAALTSSPSLLEPIAQTLSERGGLPKRRAAVAVALLVWAAGIVQVFALSGRFDLDLFGRNLFDLSDHLASNILLPLGGVAFALFAAWMIPRDKAIGGLGSAGAGFHRLWRFAAGYVAPAGVAIVLLTGLF